MTKVLCLVKLTLWGRSHSVNEIKMSEKWLSSLERKGQGNGDRQYMGVRR